MLQNTERSATFVAHVLCYILFSRHCVHSSMCCWRCLKRAHPRIFWQVLTCHFSGLALVDIWLVNWKMLKVLTKETRVHVSEFFSGSEVVWLRCSGRNHRIPATTTVMSWCQYWNVCCESCCWTAYSAFYQQPRDRVNLYRNSCRWDVVVRQGPLPSTDTHAVVDGVGWTAASFRFQGRVTGHSLSNVQ